MFSAFDFLCYAVPHNDRYTLRLENISLYFELQPVLLLSFFILHPMSYSTPSFLDVTALYCMFLQRLYTVKPATGS
jgi:hypothetical protein